MFGRNKNKLSFHFLDTRFYCWICWILSKLKVCSIYIRLSNEIPVLVSAIGGYIGSDFISFHHSDYSENTKLHQNSTKEVTEQSMLMHKQVREITCNKLPFQWKNVFPNGLYLPFDLFLKAQTTTNKNASWFDWFFIIWLNATISWFFFSEFE